VGLAERVATLLGPQGELGRRWPRFEARPAQQQMAVEVARTLERGGILLAEAPTGVGKSLAYLLPAALHALERRARVVVATATRSLQDQLFERDAPALGRALGLTIAVARLKGKQNYLCTRRLDGAVAHGEEERLVLEEMRGWAASTGSGDLDGFAGSDPETFRRLRARLGADPQACTAATCRRGRECFWVRARRRAADAQLLIVNHALLGLSGLSDSLLPEHDVLIVDEAHRLEGMLLAQLERTLTRHRFEDLLEALGGPRSARGLLGRVRRAGLPLFGGAGAGERVEELQRRSRAVREDVERFFRAVEPAGERHEVYGIRQRYHSAEELLGRDLEPLETMLGHARDYARDLSALARAFDTAGGAGSEDLAAELDQRAASWAALASDTADLGMATSRDWVYWRSATRRGVELRGSPVTLAGGPSRILFQRPRAVVLTSATLSAERDFSFTAERLGLGPHNGLDYEARAYDSPFPLDQQLRVFVYGGAQAGEAEVVADVVSALAGTTRRNQLVLLTAHERLRAARERLRARLPAGTLLLAQEWDGSAARVSDRFRNARGAVLLGVQSLWEGVDFPGEELEVLVLAKLPFSVPDDPLVAARGERLRERGLDPFRADAVPEAVLRFRQGLGRLIRRADDRGVAVICDPRLLTASYRGPFLGSLPVAPERVDRAEELASRAASFLAARGQPAEAGPAGGRNP
jgi:Rad3-related DNA helicase